MRSLPCPGIALVIAHICPAEIRWSSEGDFEQEQTEETEKMRSLHLGYLRCLLFKFLGRRFCHGPQRSWYAVQWRSMDEEKPTLQYHHEPPRKTFWPIDFGGVVAIVMVAIALGVLAVVGIVKLRW
jgi:hypothetical protein